MTEKFGRIRDPKTIMCQYGTLSIWPRINDGRHHFKPYI